METTLQWMRISLKLARAFVGYADKEGCSYGYDEELELAEYVIQGLSEKQEELEQ